MTSDSVAMSQILTVLSSEKLATVFVSDKKSHRCVAFSWPSNVLRSVLLPTEKSRTFPSSHPTHISWPSGLKVPPYAVSRNFVRLLWTSFDRGLKIWTWKLKVFFNFCNCKSIIWTTKFINKSWSFFYICFSECDSKIEFKCLNIILQNLLSFLNVTQILEIIILM